MLLHNSWQLVNHFRSCIILSRTLAERRWNFVNLPPWHFQLFIVSVQTMSSNSPYRKFQPLFDFVLFEGPSAVIWRISGGKGVPLHIYIVHDRLGTA